MISAVDLRITFDYWSLDISGRMLGAVTFPDGATPEQRGALIAESAPVRALYDAEDNGRHLGVHDDVIILLTPVQWHYEAAMRVELWTTAPPPDLADWDHVVEVDLAISAGALYFDAPSPHQPISTPIPIGAYRVRVAGRGYTDAASSSEGGPDSYRTQLWLSQVPSAPVLLKDWPDWWD
jgi:hypothetical protein